MDRDYVNPAYQSRFELLQNVTEYQTHSLYEHLMTEKPGILRKRKLRKKKDGTGITRLEYEIGSRAIDLIDLVFPDDSLWGEETPSIEPSARFQWVWDESDNTKETSRWKRTSTEYTSQATPTHLISCIDRERFGDEDEPFAFGAGYPLRGEVYTGCKGLGIFLNKQKFEPARTRSEIIIGLNEHEEENNAFLSEKLGTRFKGYNAGAMPFFLLHGHIGGAILDYNTKNVEELPCIVAAAKLTGARVHDERGRPYRFHSQQPNLDARVFITFPHINNRELTDNGKIVLVG